MDSSSTVALADVFYRGMTNPVSFKMVVASWSVAVLFVHASSKSLARGIKKAKKHFKSVTVCWLWNHVVARMFNNG